MINNICAAIILVLLGSLAIFQLLLALGKPYGQYAWGGAHKVLPMRLRIGSLISIALYVIFGLIVAGAVDWLNIFSNPYYMVFLAMYSTAGIFLNGISRGKKERVVMVPVSIMLAICSWVIALS